MEISRLGWRKGGVTVANSQNCTCHALSLLLLILVAALCSSLPQDLTFKYQLPSEDLDALISATNDDEIKHMMHEYDRLYSPNLKLTRMRLFLFRLSNSNPNSSFSSEHDCFVEALNLGLIPSQPDPIKTVAPTLFNIV
ncbi:hypothetical protein JHK82_048209 [Glycine max]|nr:hypothetical protein JHK82_048209 [Glycine max]KAG5103149.1 hypothetical protein JHK84_048118 [Glycine max]